jgi:uncharacterized protein (TIGR02594 family)
MPTPPWLATMRTLDGTEWAPHEGTKQVIQNWINFIGTKFPQMQQYCNAVLNDPYFQWCGLTVGYCMAQADLAPVFGADAVDRFLFAEAWLNWGTPVPVTAPQPGHVLIFNFGGGDHHVTLFEKDNGDGTWACHGGNQSHTVCVQNYQSSRIMGIRQANWLDPVVVAQNTPAVAG